MLSRIFQRRRRTRVGPALRPEDISFLSPVRGAHVVEPAPAAMWAVYLLLALLAAAVAWATFAQVDIVVRANARVVPDGREQVIASLEGGILRELKVREGQQVAAGDELALIDPTRFEAQQAEGQAKRLASRVVYLEHGHLIVDRPTQAFFNEPLPDAAAQFLSGELG